MKLFRQNDAGRKLLAAYEFCVRWIGIIHRRVASGFLFVFRNFGKILARLPWGPRFSLAFLPAAIITLWLSVNGASLFLVKGFFSLEPFALRNANKISLQNSDFGTGMTVRMILPDQEKLRLCRELKSSMTKDSDGEEPTKSQLKLVQKITGVDSDVLDGAANLKTTEYPEKIAVQISMEKLDGSKNFLDLGIEEPTPRQQKLVQILSREPRFDILHQPELEELLPELGKRKIDFREIVALKFTHTPFLIHLSVDLQPLDAFAKEKVEDKFDLDNTATSFPPGQYKAFRNAACAGIVDRELEKMNSHLRELAQREEEKERAELKKKAEEDIRTYKASHGKITTADKKAIYERYRAMEKKKTPLVVDKKHLKQSQISEWYLNKFKSVRFNPDNLHFDPALLMRLYDAGLEKPLMHYANWGYAVFALLLIGILAGIIAQFVPRVRRIVYYLMFSGGTLFSLYWAGVIFVAFDLPDALMELISKKELFSSSMRNEIWFDYLWFWFPAALYSFFLWFPFLLSSAKRYFQIPLRRREPGDIIAENLKCRGSNPGLYRSTYWVGAYYFIFLMLLPLLLRGCYLEDEYNVPKGDGGGRMMVQKAEKKKKKKKKKKRYLLNPNSAFIFTIPEIPDEELLQEIDEASAETYAATGVFGSGKKSGSKPGWPNGMENGVVRFIRLKYNGGDWDQDMGKGADYNMLLKLHDWTGFSIAKETEAISIDELEKRFRNKKKKPPFVYITGMKGISLTSREVKQLRDYLLRDGGLLFGDNGGGYFDRSFRAMLKRVLPNHSLVDIANDDPIYQQPYYFPNGAPILWHHSGARALGIKNNGRWIVFYHQGDINDAWKTGASGASGQVQIMAFRMGANVIAYAFSQYLAHVYGEQMQ